MERPTCQTCAYWDDGDDDSGVGLCCVHAPMILVIGIETSTRWPYTDAGEFCGEHPDFPDYLASLKKNPTVAG